MKITCAIFTVKKRYPLTISRGTSAGGENLLVTVEHDGIRGIGEMAPGVAAGGDETREAQAALNAIAADLTRLSPHERQRTEIAMASRRLPSGARAALDMALYDWSGRALGVPVWRLLGLDRDAIVPTSLTVGINPPELTRERVPEILERTGALALKVKLGSPAGPDADRAHFEAAQAAANRTVLWRVDANGGWTPDQAVNMIAWLADRGVDYVEQPLPAGSEAELGAVRRASRLPIYLDESVRTATDVARIANFADGVNLKLMKSGGITEGLRVIAAARAHGLKVMMGCMGESSLAITAAAHISPLADALDLDSHLNLAPDPFAGAELVGGRVLPGDGPGLGVRPREGA